MKENQPLQQNKSLIEEGAYKNYYLIYNRKSTDEPENQKNSLKYQQAENARFAQLEHLSIAPVTIEGFCTNGIIAEKHSAFKEDEVMVMSNNGMVQFRIERPKFYKLAQLLNQKLFKGVIFLCWDRASRNDADEAIIKKLIKNNLDIRFTLTKYDNSSSGALHMDIDGMFAQHHSRVTSEKVKLNTKNQREKGICTYGAPIGYLNVGSMANKPFDTQRAAIIKQMFELYATGEWTLSKLTEWAVAQGLKMQPKRRKRTLAERQQEEEQDNLIDIEQIERIPNKQSIHRILGNPFYIGKIYGNNREWIKSNSHEPLVSEGLFYTVKKQLAKRNISSKYSTAISYPYRGLIRCEGCLRVYTPYQKKGIQYYCVNCKGDCNNAIKNINDIYVQNAITTILEKLIFTLEEIEEINTKIKDDAAIAEIQQQQRKEQNERQKRKFKEDLGYLLSNKLNLLKTGVYTPEALMQEEQKLHQNIVILEGLENTAAVTIAMVLQNLIKLTELLKDLMLYDFIANPDEKDKLARIIFSELYVSQNGVKYQCKNGFEALEKRFVSSCAPNDWLYELPSLYCGITKSIEELGTIINYIQQTTWKRDRA